MRVGRVLTEPIKTPETRLACFRFNVKWEPLYLFHQSFESCGVRPWLNPLRKQKNQNKFNACLTSAKILVRACFNKKNDTISGEPFVCVGRVVKI